LTPYAARLQREAGETVLTSPEYAAGAVRSAAEYDRAAKAQTNHELLVGRLRDKAHAARQSAPRSRLVQRLSGEVISNLDSGNVEAARRAAGKLDRRDRQSARMRQEVRKFTSVNKAIQRSERLTVDQDITAKLYETPVGANLLRSRATAHEKLNTLLQQGSDPAHLEAAKARVAMFDEEIQTQIASIRADEKNQKDQARAVDQSESQRLKEARRAFGHEKLAAQKKTFRENQRSKAYRSFKKDSGDVTSAHIERVRAEAAAEDLKMRSTPWGRAIAKEMDDASRELQDAVARGDEEGAQSQRNRIKILKAEAIEAKKDGQGFLKWTGAERKASEAEKRAAAKAQEKAEKQKLSQRSKSVREAVGKTPAGLAAGIEARQIRDAADIDELIGAGGGRAKAARAYRENLGKLKEILTLKEKGQKIDEKTLQNLKNEDKILKAKFDTELKGLRNVQGNRYARLGYVATAVSTAQGVGSLASQIVAADVRGLSMAPAGLASTIGRGMTGLAATSFITKGATPGNIAALIGGGLLGIGGQIMGAALNRGFGVLGRADELSQDYAELLGSRVSLKGGADLQGLFRRRGLEEALSATLDSAGVSSPRARAGELLTMSAADRVRALRAHESSTGSAAWLFGGPIAPAASIAAWFFGGSGDLNEKYREALARQAEIHGGPRSAGAAAYMQDVRKQLTTDILTAGRDLGTPITMGDLSAVAGVERFGLAGGVLGTPRLQGITSRLAGIGLEEAVDAGSLASRARMLGITPGAAGSFAAAAFEAGMPKANLPGIGLIGRKNRSNYVQGAAQALQAATMMGLDPASYFQRDADAIQSAVNRGINPAIAANVLNMGLVSGAGAGKRLFGGASGFIEEVALMNALSQGGSLEDAHERVRKMGMSDKIRIAKGVSETLTRFDLRSQNRTGTDLEALMAGVDSPVDAKLEEAPSPEDDAKAARTVYQQVRDILLERKQTDLDKMATIAKNLDAFAGKFAAAVERFATSVMGG
jgi:hypothetical protein